MAVVKMSVVTAFTDICSEAVDEMSVGDVSVFEMSVE